MHNASHSLHELALRSHLTTPSLPGGYVLIMLRALLLEKAVRSMTEDAITAPRGLNSIHEFPDICCALVHSGTFRLLFHPSLRPKLLPKDTTSLHLKSLNGKISSAISVCDVQLCLFAILVSLIGYLATQTIYNIHFHPLSKFPGPKLWAATKLPFNFYSLRGTSPFKFRELHDRYGYVVRYAPNALAYITPEAWDEIYGPYKAPKKHMELDPAIFAGGLTVTGSNTITTAVDADHHRMRKALRQALSTKAVNSQEHILQSHATELVDAIKQELAGAKKPLDIAKWFSLVAFDVISDLAFGHSFENVKRGTLHRWAAVVFGAFIALPWLRVIREIPGVILIGQYATFLLPYRLKKMFYDHFNYAFDLIDARMERKDVERMDWLHYLADKVHDHTMTMDEIKESTAQLVMAGSEPPATLLAGIVYYLVTNPEVSVQATTEVRNAFRSDEDITSAELARLEYLNAVIRETMRIFPVAADVLPRLIPAGGDTILGEWLPEGTHVSICAYAASRSAKNFHDPDKFDPTRWIGFDSLTEHRNKTASRPFGQGHRACLGQVIALAETRLMLAKLLWHFDMMIVPGQGDWVSNCRSFIGWDKPSLFVDMSVRGV